MLVLDAAVEIAGSGSHASPDESPGSNASVGYGSDSCAAQCANAGTTKCALLGCGHIGTAAETNGDDDGNDWKSMSHASSSPLPLLAR